MENKQLERLREIEKEIIEIGMCRKRGVCALCENKMDIQDYNIQLCKKCRLKVSLEED